ncbi:hypothetical protein [Oxynema aestuarii]|uniref:Uncharacterized protein n=1 Tax=Oxynema aestuarii AP17 TaxID=2064643 RepID=A0A6H1TT63_9CYAN|nr:hypothetical protein [Oxynema aestuarii]QIZ69150.1 hypothetical protein HCG48_00375 [Oxynema aestuarii AP17]
MNVYQTLKGSLYLPKKISKLTCIAITLAPSRSWRSPQRLSVEVSIPNFFSKWRLTQDIP